MRIILIIASLSGGGAQRATVLLAEGFLRKGYQVTLITLYGEETDFYKLSNEVQRLALSIAKDSPTLIHAFWNNIYRLWILRKVVCSLQPNLIVSFLDRTNILTLLALANTKYPILVSEQNNPRMSSSGKFWDALRRLTYPKANKVVSSSKGVDEYFDWLPQTQRAVIYNPLTEFEEDDPSAINLPVGIEPNKKWVIAMGRLTYQKGFDIFLNAFKKIADRHPDWQIIILGEGELRTELEKLREDLKLTHQVFFPGLLSNPFPILKHSKLFVLSSRFEGFGNVLIEAMACGLPVISTDCPSGPAEIIRDGVDGILVPNEDISELATAMNLLMSNEEKRQRLATHAPEGAERFRLEKIVGRWETLFTEVIKERKVITQNEQSVTFQPQKYEYIFTVFTATYNRAHTLYRVYDSLKVQTYRNFEWLIVDDGSSDNTSELVKKWQTENLLPIRYIYQENNGKHIAFNQGVREAKGELFLNLDSDDGCVPQALERLKYHWDSIPEDQKGNFTGVTSLCQDRYGKIIGTYFPFNPTDSSGLEIRYRYKVLGEKWGFHRTNVLQQFPFTEEIKKTLVPETLVWNKIARKYKTRFINEPLRIYWIENKISLGNGGNPERNAIGRRLGHLTALNEEIDWIRFGIGRFVRSGINYSRNCFHLKISIIEQYQALETNLGKILWFINLPLGYLAYFLGKFGFLKG